MNTQEVPDWMIDASNMPPVTALQTLAKELPHGWNVQIDIERGSGGVTLFGPHDDMYENFSESSLEANLLEALRFAKFRETETEKAVNKAWARFQSEMKKAFGN
jgi:hypothetical protein